MNKNYIIILFYFRSLIKAIVFVIVMSLLG